MTKIKMKVNAEQMLKQGAREVPALGIPFGMIQSGLVNIAERAIEINDPKILWELYHMGCVELSDEEKAEIEAKIK